MVNNAHHEIINLTKLSEKEMVVENLIKAKGFSDVIVFIHEGYVNVVVDAAQLTTAQASQIQDIVVKECSVEVSKVCIAVSKAKE
jgi:stage III sporulation protein AH